jgi:two-component system, chemotaxis family, chemotaxis protein CheY
MKYGLVIDDSRVIRQVACRILQTFAFETDEAADGGAALESCRRRMPDVILIDANMPGAAAVNFLRDLRREAEGSSPYVLLCTTENDVSAIAEALNAGADEYVLKPFDRASRASPKPGWRR